MEWVRGRRVGRGAGRGLPRTQPTGLRGMETLRARARAGRAARDSGRGHRAVVAVVPERVWLAEPRRSRRSENVSRV
jgi:hypothetical protein